MSYLTGIPYGVLLMTAGYSDQVTQHHLPRSTVLPPQALTDVVLPWVAKEKKNVVVRNATSTDRDQHNRSAQGLLETL